VAHIHTEQDNNSNFISNKLYPVNILEIKIELSIMTQASISSLDALNMDLSNTASRMYEMRSKISQMTREYDELEKEHKTKLSRYIQAVDESARGAESLPHLYEFVCNWYIGREDDGFNLTKHDLLDVKNVIEYHIEDVLYYMSDQTVNEAVLSSVTTSIKMGFVDGYKCKCVAKTRRKLLKKEECDLLDFVSRQFSDRWGYSQDEFSVLVGGGEYDVNIKFDYRNLMLARCESINS